MKKNILLTNSVSAILVEMGENIKLARLRRKLSAQMVSERANIERKTLWFIEKGSPSVSIGAIINVLKVLGLEKDLSKVASDDELGRKIQDANLITRKRAPKNKS